MPRMFKLHKHNGMMTGKCSICKSVISCKQYFHGLFNIPENSMLGTLNIVKTTTQFLIKCKPAYNHLTLMKDLVVAISKKLMNKNADLVMPLLTLWNTFKRLASEAKPLVSRQVHATISKSI